MTTYRDLQNAVLNTVHSQTLDQEERCTLTADIGTTDTTLSVDDATQISRGLIEIDSELLWVKSVDTTNGLLTVPPFGRGYGETTAATHTANTMVVNSPRYPRQYVKAAIQECLSQIYPELFVVKKDETQSAVATKLTYQVPADCDWIVKVEWQTIGPSGLWKPIRRWNFDPTADSTAFTTGKSLDILEAMVPGRTIKVTYGAAPGALVNDSDTLASTGLGETARDVIVFGAVARLLQSMEAARLQTTTIAQSDREALVQPGAATAASRAYWQMYQMRLADERERLLRLYPHHTHFTR